MRSVVAVCRGARRTAQSPMAAAPSTPARSLVGDEAPLLCGACGEHTTLQDSRVRGQRGVQRWDIACSTAWRLYSLRFKKHPALRIAWQAKTPDQQQTWFREQKVLHQPAKRRRFDDVKVAEASFQERKHEEGEITDWVPFDRWEITERARHPGIAQAEARQCPFSPLDAFRLGCRAGACICRTRSGGRVAVDSRSGSDEGRCRPTCQATHCDACLPEHSPGRGSMLPHCVWHRVASGRMSVACCGCAEAFSCHVAQRAVIVERLALFTLARWCCDSRHQYILGCFFEVVSSKGFPCVLERICLSVAGS